MKIAQLDLTFPLGGLVEFTSYVDQPAGGRDSLPTTASCLNVRGFDPRSGRARGGQRAGLTRYVNAQVSGAGRIQDLIHVIQRDGTPSATNQALRTATSVYVSGGNLGKFTTSGFTPATGGTAAFSATVPQVFSVVHFQQLYFADGLVYKTYDPTTNTVSAWDATDELNEDGDDGGEMPVDAGNRCRLIEVYRGRILLSGLKSDPQNWFMSAVGFAMDWNYGPTTTCATQAVAGNNADAGKCPDIVNAVIPYTDDRAIFGGDHSIWVLQGDPMEQGRFDRISESTGIAFGRAWCIDPSGIIFFYGSRGGVFSMSAGSLPQRISKEIDERLAETNLDTHVVRLAWNDREQGVHVFISPLTTGTTTHYFFDARNQAWWADRFANTSHNPTTVHILDGDASGDRVLLLGGQDGRIYKWDIDALQDDTTGIASHVMIGPIRGRGRLRGTYLREIQATLAEGSGNVAYSMYADESAEAALAATTPKFTGTWQAGRNRAERRRCQGAAMFLKLANSGNDAWAMERIEAEIADLGAAQSR